MSKEKVTVVSNGGPGLGVLLFLVFLVLKLTGIISWSWLWVTAPLWISFLLCVLVLAVLAVLAVVCATVYFFSK